MRGVVVAASLALAALVLSACRGDGALAAKAEREDTRLARRQIDWVRRGDVESLQAHLSAELRGPGMAAELDRAAAMFPPEEPLAVQLVEHRRQGEGDERRVSMSFQLRFPSQWVAVNVILRPQGERLLVSGLRIEPLEAPLEELHRFSLVGATSAHYAVASAAVVVLAVILTALVLCVRASMPLQHKWLWMLAIVCGVGRLTFNWTSGEHSWSFIYAQPLGVGVFSASAYAPWLVSVSAPVGALWFVLASRRRPTRAGT